LVGAKGGMSTSARSPWLIEGIDPERRNRADRKNGRTKEMIEYRMKEWSD